MITHCDVSAQIRRYIASVLLDNGYWKYVIDVADCRIAEIANGELINNWCVTIKNFMPRFEE